MAYDKPPPYFPTIHADFPAHEAFIKERKTVAADRLILGRERNVSGYVGELSIASALIDGAFRWVAWRSLKLRVSYRFAVRSEIYGSEPCFRFDSCGTPHRNDIGTLSEQQILTPHFHSVRADGILYAYKTPELEDPVQGSAIANDPQLGANHFCQELNLAAPSGGSVVLKVFTDQIGLTSSNPLDGASFPRTL